MFGSKMFTRHAVGAPKVATVSDRYAQVMKWTFTSIHEAHVRVSPYRFLNLYYKGSCLGDIRQGHEQGVDDEASHQNGRRCLNLGYRHQSPALKFYRKNPMEAAAIQESCHSLVGSCGSIQPRRGHPQPFTSRPGYFVHAALFESTRGSNH